MTVEPQDFRDALRKFASGVTLVTVTSEGRMHGMTASSFASVSLDPPLVLVSLSRSSHTHSLITREQVFAVNVLAEEDEDIAKRFAQSGDKEFKSSNHVVGQTGAPLLESALATLECKVWRIVEGGDHDVVIGQVEACASRDGRPLLYFDRAYRRF